MSERRHVETFKRYLQSQKDYKLINKDQWTSFLRFSEEVCEKRGGPGKVRAGPERFLPAYVAVVLGP